MVNQAEPLSSGDVISAKLFKELSFPRVKAANQAIAKRIKTKSLHICGNTTKILDLIAESETNLFSMDYKVDLNIARETLSGKVAYGGQLDPISVLLEGTTAEIEAESLACIRAGGTPGFVLTRISSNGVCRPQKYSIPRFFSVTTFSHSLRFSGV